MPVVINEGSTGTVAILVAVKAVAYAVSLGCGFRGGAIFPAIFLGVGLASLAVVWVDASPTWAVAVEAAAGMAAESRLLVAPLLLGALLVGTAPGSTPHPRRCSPRPPRGPRRCPSTVAPIRGRPRARTP